MNAHQLPLLHLLVTVKLELIQRGAVWQVGDHLEERVSPEGRHLVVPEVENLERTPLDQRRAQLDRALVPELWSNPRVRGPFPRRAQAQLSKTEKRCVQMRVGSRARGGLVDIGANQN
jgi:hypothetical protein